MFNNENRSTDAIVVVIHVDINCTSAVSTSNIPGAPVLPTKLTNQNLSNQSVSDQTSFNDLLEVRFQYNDLYRQEGLSAY